jgi:hypothetical protein
MSDTEMISSGFELKDEAVEVIGTAIRQRQMIKKLGRSFIIEGEDHLDVYNNYKAYRNSWTVRGVCRFMVRHYNTILELIPPQNKPLRNRFIKLAEVAVKILGAEESALLGIV